MTEGQGPLGERMAGLEATNSLVVAKLDKLDEIAIGTARNTDLLQGMTKRLEAGDKKMDGHEERLDDHEKQIGDVKKRLKDLDGDDVWPSWAKVQQAHMKSGWTRSLVKAAFAMFMAGLGVIGTWLTAPIWHSGK